MSADLPSASSTASLQAGAVSGASSREHSCARCDGTNGDPFAATYSLGASVEGWRAWTGYLAGATLLQVLLAFGSITLGTMRLRQIPTALPVVQLEIDVTKEDPPPPPKEVAEDPPPVPVAPVVRTAPLKEAPPPAAAAAKASAVLTQAPDPNEPLDLTGNTVIVGNSDSFAGGATMSNGTSDTAVRTRVVAPSAVAAAARPAPVAAAPVKVGPDRSRTVQYSGGSDWHCTFPSEADTAQIDDRYVTITVSIGADGRLLQVSDIQNGDHGFAGAADRCAHRQTFGSALDHDGNPIEGKKSFRVHFER